MKKTVLLALAILIGGVCAFTFAADETATVKFVNQSGVTLRFSIDGRAGPTVPSGEQGFDTTTIGNHTLKAETLNGKQSVTHSGYIGANGWSWTVTPPKQK
jgi:hypothetical protein